MKQRIINFFKRHPELLFEYLEQDPYIINYDVDLRNLSQNTGGCFRFKDGAYSDEFSFISKYDSEIRYFFKKHLGKEISIGLNKLYFIEELEAQRISQLELITKDDKYRWSVESNSVGPWSNNIIDKFQAYWDWGRLSRNQFIELTPELIDEYKFKWDWSGLNWHKNLPSSNEDFIRNNWHRLNLKNVAIPYKILGEKIENFSYEGLYDLSWNANIKWTTDIISRAYDKKSKFSDQEFQYLWRNLSSNPSIPWSLELLEKYESRWDWSYLSKNPSLPWSPELINLYSKRWDWDVISENIGISWSLNFIEDYKSCLNFKKLSTNPKIPWTIPLIDLYKDKWDWTSIIRQNVALMGVFFERYRDYIDWSGSLVSTKGDFGTEYYYYDNRIANIEGIILTREMVLFLRDKWKKAPIIDSKDVCHNNGEWNKVSYNFILNMDLVDEFFELFDIINLIENNSVKSFQLIELIETKLGKHAFLQFLDDDFQISYPNEPARKSISTKKRIWLNILRYHFNEELLINILKTD